MDEQSDPPWDESLAALAIPKGPWVLRFPDKITIGMGEKVFEWCAANYVRRPLIIVGDFEILDENEMRTHGWIRAEEEK